MARDYGITLAKGYKKSFASFKKELGHVAFFRKFPKEKQDAEQRKAYEDLTGKKVKTSGNIHSGKGNSQKDNTNKGQ